MLAVTRSAAVLGIDAYPVGVEVDLQLGLPHVSTVGLAEAAVREGKDRVRAAVKNSGFDFPGRHVTISLTPADIRKDGSALDLPIAIAILAATGQAPAGRLSGFLLMGELSLDGALRPVRGVLPVAALAARLKVEGLLVPRENAAEAAVVTGLRVIPVQTLTEVVKFLAGELEIGPARPAPPPEAPPLAATDLQDIRGQEHAKRALEVAAAGGHNILLIGPPGAGKTMLARRFPTILPPLNFEEALETSKVHSVLGMLPRGGGLLRERPFRAPHHTLSDAGLIGGGAIPKPGEVSLATNGVLFLDELPEFQRNVLEVLRQPLEEGHVTLSRAAVSLTYPAKFMLVAAMNPCPCGYLGDAFHECTCSVEQIRRYRSRISGPLLDRIDIQVEVGAVRYRDLADTRRGEKSSEVLKRVVEARQVQSRRFSRSGIHVNARMTPALRREQCPLAPEAERLMERVVDRLGLSARAWDRIIKVGRTIADLDGSDIIGPAHLAEAVQYRSLDRPLRQEAA
ncbi:MAG: YifB family Mg chelatase-like AAA ATPase [Deltaproteobacteria bacterium]|nr:YifB family Mg chelatase-like AAA ATPase [Deltaproteobacteria bacterium]